MQDMSTLAGQMVAQYGYAGLGLTLMVNCMGIPIPSEITLPLSGFAAHSGQMDLVTVMLVAVSAQMAGLFMAYAIARHGGLHLIEKYGHYMFIRHKHIMKAQKLFAREGSQIILVGLCLPGVHGYMGYPAGLARMNVWLFGVLAFIGSVVWAGVLVTLGYVAGQHLDKIMAAFHSAALVVVAVLAVGGILYWYSKRYKRARHAR
jgi:membrane protein DedA with SNARE-associated domain